MSSITFKVYKCRFPGCFSPTDFGTYLLALNKQALPYGRNAKRKLRVKTATRNPKEITNVAGQVVADSGQNSIPVKDYESDEVEAASIPDSRNFARLSYFYWCPEKSLLFIAKCPESPAHQRVKSLIQAKIKPKVRQAIKKIKGMDATERRQELLKFAIFEVMDVRAIDQVLDSYASIKSIIVEKDKSKDSIFQGEKILRVIEETETEQRSPLSLKQIIFRVIEKYSRGKVSLRGTLKTSKPKKTNLGKSRFDMLESISYNDLLNSKKIFQTDLFKHAVILYIIERLKELPDVD